MNRLFAIAKLKFPLQGYFTATGAVSNYKCLEVYKY